MANIWDNDDLDWARSTVLGGKGGGLGTLVSVPVDWNLPLSEYRKWYEGMVSQHGAQDGWGRKGVDTVRDFVNVGQKDSFAKYIEHQAAVRDGARRAYEASQEQARKQAEHAAETARKEQLIRTQKNLSNTTEAVGNMQTDNRPNVESGAPATTADTSGTDLGSDLRKRRGRRVSTNLGL